MVLNQGDAAIIDDCLAELPILLSKRGLELKQKRGYKAGKLSRTRNWCQFIDGDVPIPVTFPNSQGRVKTWKLFARFGSNEPPSWPWDRPERYERKKAQWMPAGDDVWGIAYEDIRDWAKSATDRQLLERLVSDLLVSFDYSRQRYC